MRKKRADPCTLENHILTRCYKPKDQNCTQTFTPVDKFVSPRGMG